MVSPHQAQYPALQARVPVSLGSAQGKVGTMSKHRPILFQPGATCRPNPIEQYHSSQLTIRLQPRDASRLRTWMARTLTARFWTVLTILTGLQRSLEERPLRLALRARVVRERQALFNSELAPSRRLSRGQRSRSQILYHHPDLVSYP